MSSWRDRVLAAEATKAGSASVIIIIIIIIIIDSSGTSSRLVPYDFDSLELMDRC